jgi:hypothetical protein
MGTFDTVTVALHARAVDTADSASARANPAAPVLETYRPPHLGRHAPAGSRVALDGAAAIWMTSVGEADIRMPSK